MRRIDERDYLEKELIQAKKELFKVDTIRQVKLIQDRIRFLNERIKELNTERK